MIEALLLALHAFAPRALAAQVPPVLERPRDPWVFRSVLDGRPRIVTLALHREMWVAYDAQTCGMYQCWKGGVEFEGAVYTTVHGDQPKSFGALYTRGLDGPVWSADVNGKRVPVEAVWRGYFLREGRAHLQYELVLPGGIRIAMQETTDYASTEQLLPEDEMDMLGLVHGMPVLYRSFLAEAIPDGVALLLRLRTDFDTVRRRETFPPDVLFEERIVEGTDAAGTPTKHVLSTLPFTSGRLGANVGIFFDPLPDPEPAHASGGATKQTSPASPASGASAPAKKD